jgi:lipopolysaccharide/colanic/teichoic acid biosynthesis glycosyltransferase
VLFKQKRHGFNNEVIEVYKFRSMYADRCDPSGEAGGDQGTIRASRASAASSARLRSTSCRSSLTRCSAALSLVGPRPHAVAAQSHNKLYDEVVDGYFARHRVKPGVTGWAQINGWRGEMDTEDKIRMRTEYDLHYIENWSLWFDIKILVLTPIRLLNTENAY